MLALNLLLAKCRVGEDIAQNLYGAIQVTGEAFGIEDGLFPAGVGIQMSSHVLNLKPQPGLGSLGSAFESHVLQEVCHSVVGSILVPGSSVNPKTNSGCGGATVFTGHPHTIV